MQTLSFVALKPFSHQTSLEQLPIELIKSISTLLSFVGKKQLHLVSSQFTLLLNDRNYFANFLIKKIESSQKKISEGGLSAIVLEHGLDIKKVNLSRLISLQHRYKIKDSFIQSVIINCKNLSTLNLSRSPNSHARESISEITIECLTNLKNLNYLNLSNWSISDLAFGGVLKVTQLQHLIITEISCVSLQSLEKSTQLKTLDLTFDQKYCIITTKILLNVINQLKEVRVLRFKEIMGDILLMEIAKLQNLSELDIQFSGVSRIGIEKITQFTNLLILNLCGNQFLDEGGMCVAKLTSLKKLSLAWANVTNGSVIAIAKSLTRLEVLNLNSNFLINEEVLEILSKLRLREISLQKTFILEKAVENKLCIKERLSFNHFTLYQNAIV